VFGNKKIQITKNKKQKRQWKIPSAWPWLKTNKLEFGVLERDSAENKNKSTL